MSTATHRTPVPAVGVHDTPVSRLVLTPLGEVHALLPSSDPSSASPARSTARQNASEVHDTPVGRSVPSAGARFQPAPPGSAFVDVATFPSMSTATQLEVSGQDTPVSGSAKSTGWA